MLYSRVPQHLGTVKLLRIDAFEVVLNQERLVDCYLYSKIFQ